MNRKDCFDEIARKTGRSKKDVQDLLEQILERADSYEEQGTPKAEAYARARDEKLKEIFENAAREHRAAIMDGRKEANRRRDYARTEQQLNALPAGKGLADKLAVQGPHIAMEAKLVGTNFPVTEGRKSVDAQFVARRQEWVGGFGGDLDRGGADGQFEDAGLFKLFASRVMQDDWADELFEINKSSGGNPGITKNPLALAIAKTIQKWQRVAMDAINGEGGWVRSYSGFITKSSWHPDKIREAGAEQFVGDMMSKDADVDLRRTFGTSDPQRARDAFYKMFTPLGTGNHFDYGRPVDEPLYPNTAASASASREIHFKSGKGWRWANAKYGITDPTETVVQSLVTAARRSALMAEYGTRPREAYEADKRFRLAQLQTESEGLTSRLSALNQALASPNADAAAKAKIEAELVPLREKVKVATAKFKDYESWQEAFDNRFAQIDGTSLKPIDSGKANFVANVMSVQRTSKLGNILMTHLASLPTKALEGSYWGASFAERYRSLFTGFTQGAEGSSKREVIDATLVALEDQLGHMMNQYDVADAPAGFLSKWEAIYFKLTGVKAVIGNQRAGFQAMAASILGRQRDSDWAALDRKAKRVVQGFGLGEAEWKALRGVDWTTVEGRTYLFPSDARKLSDDQVRAYLKEAPDALLSRREPTAEDLEKTRQDLALTLAATYSDRSGYAIPMPSARIRAMLFGKDYAPGTNWNMAKKLFWQFKIWPADMITRAWGREMYGRIGDGRMDRVAGMVEGVVAAMVFGVAAEGLRDIIKGVDPVEKIKNHPIAALLAGAQRSGMGSIIGDFLLGQFDRHGLSAAANMLGPTFGQIDDLADLLHAGGRTKQGMFSGSAMRERGATLLKMVRNNTPFMNLWATSLAMNTLVWHRMQEWISPGYLQRSEQRQKDLEGTKFWVAPHAADQWVTGKRTSPL